MRVCQIDTPSFTSAASPGIHLRHPIFLLTSSKKVNDGELAARLNKSRKYVNQVATGNKPASLKMYACFAKALQVPLAALFDGYPLRLLDD